MQIFGRLDVADVLVYVDQKLLALLVAAGRVRASLVVQASQMLEVDGVQLAVRLNF